MFLTPPERDALETGLVAHYQVAPHYAFLLVPWHGTEPAFALDAGASHFARATVTGKPARQRYLANAGWQPIHQAPAVYEDFQKARGYHDVIMGVTGEASPDDALAALTRQAARDLTTLLGRRIQLTPAVNGHHGLCVSVDDALPCSAALGRPRRRRPANHDRWI